MIILSSIYVVVAVITVVTISYTYVSLKNLD